MGPHRKSHRRTVVSVLLGSLVLALGISSLGLAPAGRGAQLSRFDVAWRAQLNKPAFFEYAAREASAPVVDPARGWIFVADRFGVLRSLDAMGRWRWQADVGGKVEAGLLLDGSMLYVATVRGKVACFDAFTGEELWSYQGNNELATTPTIAGGRLLVPSLSDTLLALDAATGEFAWFHRRPRTDGLTIRGAAPVVAVGRRVIAGFSDGSVIALSMDDGRVVWSSQVGNGEHRDVKASPIVREGVVYVASYSGSLHALDLANGRQLWSARIALGAVRMTRFGELLIIGSTDTISAHRMRDGDLEWETVVTGGTPTGLLIHGGRLFFGNEDGHLMALCAQSGMPLAAFATGTGVSAAPVPVQDGVWLWSNGGWLYRLVPPSAGWR